jgi:uncharacterized protein (DUF779 family)
MLEHITLIDPAHMTMEAPLPSIPRITATSEALELLEVIRTAHGAVLFHQSGGCCDGSQPMCFPQDEFRMGTQDVLLGTIDGAGFWMHREQFEYWKHCQLTLDVVPGRGSSFSLEIPYGKRFIIRSRVFTDAELQALQPVAAQ